MKTPEDKILDFLRNTESPVPADELAARFLNVAGPSTSLAERVVNALLGRDRRFKHTPAGWVAAAPAAPPVALTALPWIVLGGERITVGPLAATLVLILEYQPTEPGTSRTCFYLVGKEGVTPNMVSEASRQYDLRCEGMTELGMLSRLETVFSQNALFLKALHAGGISWLLRSAEETGIALPDPFYTLADCCRIATADPGPVRPEEVYRFFDIAVRREDPLLNEADALPAILAAVLEEFQAQDIQNLDQLDSRLAELRPPLDFSQYDFSPADLAGLPERPGVYLLHDSAGQVIYVGKSVNLRRRLGGYFRWRCTDDPKLDRIQAETHRYSVIAAGSDLEALLEESRLIAEVNPPINTQMETHETPYQKPLAEPVVVLLPHADADRFQLFVLHPSGQVWRLAASRSAPETRSLEGFLEAACEKAQPFPPAVAYPPMVFPLALRWVRKNTEGLIFIRYNDYADKPAAVQAVLGLLPDVN